MQLSMAIALEAEPGETELHILALDQRRLDDAELPAADADERCG
jgi:hypothetical protein